MVATVKKRHAPNRLRKAAGLCLLLSAGNFGCAGSGKIRPGPKQAVVASSHTQQIPLESHQKELNKGKAALMSELNRIEIDVLVLQAEKSILELNYVLRKMVELKDTVNISKLEPLGIEGWNLLSMLKENLSRKDKDALKIQNLSTQAESVCSRLRIDFEKVRQLLDIDLVNQIQNLKKQISKLSVNAVRKIIHKKKIDTMRKRLLEMRAEREMIAKLTDPLKSPPEARNFSDRIDESRAKLEELKSAMAEFRVVESTISIRKKIKWLEEIRSAQEKQGIDSSLTKVDITKAQTALKAFEKAARSKE